MTPKRILTAILVSALLAVGLPAGADPASTVRREGYIELPDGTGLKYSVVYPNDGQPHPTLFEYSGYNPGSVPDQPYIDRFVPKGYAFIGVNIRGTGCSDGTFDFFEPQQAVDGKYVIDEFIAKQPWSNGRVAMIGKSYPGITQLFVAEQRPEHLVAIAPGHAYGDIYRDVANPGGILNYAFAGLWSFAAQPAPGYQSAATASVGGDQRCARNMVQHTATNAPHNPFAQAAQNPYFNGLHVERSPETDIAKINVPVLTAIAWQDEQVGPRSVEMLPGLTAPWWAVVTNGDHGMYRTPQGLNLLESFMDHFLAGVNNGFENNPRLMVWWESDVATRSPSWTTGANTWPVDTTAKTLYLGASGGLTDTAPGAAELPDPYAYPAGSQGIGNARYSGVTTQPDQYLWPAKPAPGTALAYTSNAFTQNTTLLGTASLDLWLASSAPDTDLQVTLTELRADGQETYIQKGWLRASHRKLDEAKSTPLRPYQTHTESDSQLLTPGQPTPMRVEIFPFGQVIRAGSKIRVWVEAPTAVPELWGMAFLPTPAVNLVYHDAAHPSALVLPVVSNMDLPSDRQAQPACMTVIRQPCRAG